jgi:Fe-S-cluster containining protein
MGEAKRRKQAANHPRPEHDPDAVKRGEIMLDPARNMGAASSTTKLPPTVLQSITSQVAGFIAKDLGCDTREKAMALAAREPVKVAQYVDSLIDSLFDPGMEIAGAPAACRAGCSWCCWMIPGLRSGEVDLLLTAIARLPEEEGAEIKAKVKLAATAIVDAGSSEAAYPLRCPLLGDDGRCRVYTARPAACRAFASTDATACERLYRGGDQESELPMTIRSAYAQVAYVAVNNTFGDNRLKATPLPIALAEALEMEPKPA